MRINLVPIFLPIAIGLLFGIKAAAICLLIQCMLIAFN